MVENENIYDKIKELLGNVNGQLSILEDKIDPDVQTEYYSYSKKISKESKPDDVIRIKEPIQWDDLPFEDQKNLLVRLASVDDLEAYRIIETSIRAPLPGLSDSHCL